MKPAVIGLGVVAGAGAALALRARKAPTLGWSTGVSPVGWAM